ncbi:MAG: hypothetical protein LBC57_04430 [Treponema sp.]|jgi:archaellum component FlaC|nr:hypothetical protein [Treponema sp.]
MAEMTAQEAAEWGKTLDFEKVWAMFAEVGKKHAEIAQRQAENEKLMAQLEKNVERAHNDIISVNRAGDERLAQLEKNLDRAHNDIISVNRAGDERLAQLEKNVERVSNEINGVNRAGDERLAQLEKNVERVSNNVGGLNRSIGELVETLIAARLWEKFPDYNLTRAYQRLPVYDEKNALKTDIDILLVNTDMCMAVEVKHRLNRIDEVDYHLKRMQLIRQYPPEQVGNKQLIGGLWRAALLILK